MSMLMLCIYLYHRLPHYLPRSKIEFTGPLHANVTKQVSDLSFLTKFLLPWLHKIPELKSLGLKVPNFESIYIVFNESIYIENKTFLLANINFV